MNNNNINGVAFEYFQNGGNIQSQTNSYLDINGANNGTGALRLLNYGGLVQISPNGGIFIQPASGQNVDINGSMRFYQATGTPLNMNGNNITNVSSITAGATSVLTIGTNTTQPNNITFNNYGGSLGDVKINSYNITIGDGENGTIALNSGTGGYISLYAQYIEAQGNIYMNNNNILNVGYISGVNRNVLAFTSGFSRLTSESNLLVNSGTGYVEIQANSDASGTGNIYLTGSYIEARGTLNMLNHDINGIAVQRFNAGAYLQSYVPGGFSNAFLDINGTGGDSALRIINGSANMLLRGNGDAEITPASGHNVILNGSNVGIYAPATNMVGGYLDMYGHNIINAPDIGSYTNMNIHATYATGGTVNISANQNVNVTANALNMVGTPIQMNGSFLTGLGNVYGTGSADVTLNLYGYNLNLANNGITNVDTLNGHNLYQYGQWACTASATLEGNTPTPMTWDIGVYDVGFSPSSGGTYLTASKEGYYKVITTIVLSKSGGSGTSAAVYAWIETTGDVQVANSCRHVDIKGGETGEITINQIIYLTAGNAFRIVVATSETTVSFTTIAAQTSPYARPQVPTGNLSVTIIA